MFSRREFLQTATVGGAAFFSLVNSGITAANDTKNRPDAVKIPKPAPRFGDGRDWWFEKRFGLFIHWGLYAINGWHEQDQWRRRIPRSEYVKLMNQWNPVKFNPDQWLDIAEEAGMKYLCITTKHHDGFCLFNTKYTDYNVMNTPYKRDIIKMVVDACHRRNFPICLYYSIADWHHPNYPNQGRHHELPPQPGDNPDLLKYTEFVKAQIRELCSNYGEIHGIWWDMNVDKHRDPSINEMIRKLQPKAVINNRGYDEGDFGTPERDFDKSVDEILVFEKRTEACQSVGAESWGYRKDEDYYTTRYLIRSIDKYLARGANYLLNVGPKPDGTFPDEAVRILQGIGKWYHKVRESLEDVSPVSYLTANRDVLLTHKGNNLYVHIYKDPIHSGVKLKPISIKPERAILLNTGEEIQCAVEMLPSDHTEQKAYLHLKNLPVEKYPDTVLVVKLEFKDISALGI
jgi:alpha-L-fucosidase